MEVNFWKGFFNAINCEFKPLKEIQGASGIKHNILCLGLDETKKRIVIVQDEQDARILTMVQADIQAKIKDYNILMVRPVTVNLSMAFTALGLLFGSYKLMKDDLKELSDTKEGTEKFVEANKKKFESVINVVSPQIEIIQKTKLSVVPIIKEAVQQLSHLKFLANAGEKDAVIDFSELITFNPVVYDTALGICPIPLYDFSVAEAECFIDKQDLEENISILQKHAIHQFFYPPADSLALGFVETEKYKPTQLIQSLSQVPDFGHPFGKNELTDVTNINDMVDSLKEKGLVVEGEFNVEITAKGVEKRMAVKFKPRESIYKRIANVLSLKVDINLKDIFGTGGGTA